MRVSVFIPFSLCALLLMLGNPGVVAPADAFNFGALLAAFVAVATFPVGGFVAYSVLQANQDIGPYDEFFRDGTKVTVYRPRSHFKTFPIFGSHRWLSNSQVAGGESWKDNNVHTVYKGGIWKTSFGILHKPPTGKKVKFISIFASGQQTNIATYEVCKDGFKNRVDVNGVFLPCPQRRSRMWGGTQQSLTGQNSGWRNRFRAAETQYTRRIDSNSYAEMILKGIDGQPPFFDPEHHLSLVIFDTAFTSFLAKDCFDPERDPGCLSEKQKRVLDSFTGLISQQIGGNGNWQDVQTVLLSGMSRGGCFAPVLGESIVQRLMTNHAMGNVRFIFGLQDPACMKKEWRTLEEDDHVKSPWYHDAGFLDPANQLWKCFQTDFQGWATDLDEEDQQIHRVPKHDQCWLIAGGGEDAIMGISRASCPIGTSSSDIINTWNDENGDEYMKFTWVEEDHSNMGRQKVKYHSSDPELNAPFPVAWSMNEYFYKHAHQCFQSFYSGGAYICDGHDRFGDPVPWSECSQPGKPCVADSNEAIQYRACRWEDTTWTHPCPHQETRPCEPTFEQACWWSPSQCRYDGDCLRHHLDGTRARICQSGEIQLENGLDARLVGQLEPCETPNAVQHLDNSDNAVDFDLVGTCQGVELGGPVPFCGWRQDFTCHPTSAGQGWRTCTERPEDNPGEEDVSNPSSAWPVVQVVDWSSSIPMNPFCGNETFAQEIEAFAISENEQTCFGDSQFVTCEVDPENPPADPCNGSDIMGRPIVCFGQPFGHSSAYGDDSTDCWWPDQWEGQSLDDCVVDNYVPDPPCNTERNDENTSTL